MCKVPGTQRGVSGGFDVEIRNEGFADDMGFRADVPWSSDTG